MNRLLVLALSLVIASLARAQPDPNAHGIGRNPPEAQPVRPQDPPRRQPPKPDTPENAARRFVGDIAGYFEPSFTFDVAGARVGYFGPDDFEWAFKNLPTIRALSTVKIDNVRVENQTDNEATVSFTLRPLRPNQGEGEAMPVSLVLRREGNPPGPNFNEVKDAWRVVPPPIEDVLAKPLYETPPLQLAAALATRDPRLLLLIQQYRGLSQLKQLGLGALQFSQDYDEFFVFDDAAHERALRPYLKDDALYTIVGTKDVKWRFNDNLSTLSLAQVKESALTVLFYDGEAPADDKLNFRFGDKTLICFADGHCKALSKNELGDLIWKP